MECLIKLVFLIFCASPIFCVESSSDPIVQLSNGKILGRDHGHFLSFESIPYAEPPIGENRFEDPKPFASNWSDIRDATKPPVICMQWDQYLFKEDLLDGQEDCLTINIYTPSLSGKKKYPVLFLIHGGAFMFGTAAQNGHDLIMKQKNTVVVKINYRLGPLGFLSTSDDIISGNFGLKDQLLALQWTKANVAAFNGDPESITAIGYSAGAAAVHLHMMNKNFENLVKRAISISGTAFCDWVITKKPEKRAIALAKHLDCPIDSSSAIKSCLKKKNAIDIVRGVQSLQNVGYNPSIVFGPVIESKTVLHSFINEFPEDIIKSGKSAQIPWLSTYTGDDGAYNAAEMMQKDANGKELIEILNDRWNELAPINLFFQNSVEEHELDNYANSLKEKYLGNKNFSAQNYPLIQKMYTDLIFANGAKKAWKLHKEYTDSPVYGYVFESPAPYGIGNMLARRTDISFGCAHGDDYFLIFNNKNNLIPLTKTQIEESEMLIKMVYEFCTKNTLQYGDCKLRENNSKTKGFYVLQIGTGSCESNDFENVL